MKRIAFLLISLLMVNTLFAGKTNVEGRWLITKAENNGKVSSPYQTVIFGKDGMLAMMDVPIGTWKMKGDKLNLVSEMFEKKDEDYKILRAGKNEIVLKSNTQTLYLKRLDDAKVRADNEASGLMGKWQVNGDYPEMIRMLDFQLPDQLSIVETETGMSSTYGGNWIYQPKDGSVILIVLGTPLRGKYDVLINGEQLLLKNDQITLTGKPAQSMSELIHLDFTEDDFYDADGNYKYDDAADKLPWQDVYTVIQNLAKYKSLVYKYTNVNPDTQIPETKTLTAEVKYDDINGGVCVDYIFNGYDKNHLPEDTQLPPNCYNDGGYNDLFPYKGDTYRVGKAEQITVPAGTFDCVVVDVVGDFDSAARLWMVKDQPGVIAKIIQEKKGDFGFYKVFELEKLTE
jgi:hypothetical protein